MILEDGQSSAKSIPKENAVRCWVRARSIHKWLILTLFVAVPVVVVNAPKDITQKRIVQSCRQATDVRIVSSFRANSADLYQVKRGSKQMPPPRQQAPLATARRRRVLLYIPPLSTRALWDLPFSCKLFFFLHQMHHFSTFQLIINCSFNFLISYFLSTPHPWFTFGASENHSRCVCYCCASSLLYYYI